MRTGPIVAIVPALDEAPRIATVLRGLPSSIAPIIVIDDGSTDGTGAVAQRDERVTLLRNERPRGVGAALAQGFLQARALDVDAAVVLAGDGQMDPLDLPHVLAPVLAGTADFVQGDRLAWPGGVGAMPLDRWLGVQLLALLTRRATGLPVRDAQCGYVALSRHALRTIAWETLWTSYGYPNDLLLRVAEARLRVHFVPVRPVYEGAPSKLRWKHVPPIVGHLLRAQFAASKGSWPRPFAPGRSERSVRSHVG